MGLQVPRSRKRSRYRCQPRRACIQPRSRVKSGRRPVDYLPGSELDGDLIHRWGYGLPVQRFTELMSVNRSPRAEPAGIRSLRRSRVSVSSSNRADPAFSTR